MIGRPSDLLMARLKAERPVWRLNWSLTASERLNLAPWFAAEHGRAKHAVTAENAGERCCLRVERQGLARLSHSNTVLFTIHTYTSRLSATRRAPLERAQRLLGVLRTAPPEVLAYKGITPFAAALRAYLEHAVAAGLSSCDQPELMSLVARRMACVCWGESVVRSAWCVERISGIRTT